VKGRDIPVSWHRDRHRPVLHSIYKYVLNSFGNRRFFLYVAVYDEFRAENGCNDEQNAQTR